MGEAMSTKKIIATLMILLAVTSVFAKSKKKSNQFEVGGLLTIGVPAGSTFKGTYGDWADDTKAFGAFDFGAAALAHLSLDSLVENLGAQAEIRFASNAITGEFSVGETTSKKEYTFKYVSIDLPVFATYSIALGDFILMPEAGFYLSIPVGKMKIPGAFGDDQTIDTPVTLGLLLGIGGSYPVGPGSIVADLRFINDLPSIKVDSEKFMTRRGLLLSAGYKIPLDIF